MDTDAITTLLQDVAAEVITPRFRSLDEGEVHEKNPGDLVTVADHEAEVLITAALHGAYPGAVVLGEEATAADPGLLDRFAAAAHGFTVDPVDGTKNFVHGSPDHAVMAAELREGVVVRSWIWQPQHQRAYVAERGAGAWRNGTRLTAGPVPVSPRGRTSRRAWVGRRLGEHPELTLTWASCGIDFPHLVEGDVDYLLYAGTKPWDHAPGALLVAEAGGAVGTLHAGAYDPRHESRDGMVAAADATTYEAARSGWDGALRGT
ncbi:MAG: inositol monophosphatase [Nocardioides sp.]|uniref:inositol monophosphatase family protein n=1 Tax=Nocardioides sp. TaxID=35761 RepID=UPI002396BF2C|nr:inositol monophosphatase [Nocardioides sp.]MDE0774819.1 inositol monophosphatase [Nocardioides sp.]